MWEFLCCCGLMLAGLPPPGAALHRVENLQKVEYQYDVEKWLNTIDGDLSRFNALAAHFTWELSTNPDDKKAQQARELGRARNRWRNKVCASAIRRSWTTPEQRRKIYLLCRGPKFDDDAVIEYLDVLGRLAQEYNAEICLGAGVVFQYNASDFPKPGDCLYGEPDLERIMKRQDLTAEQLQWIWMNWHNSVGPKIKPLFRKSIGYQNEAARNNGYADIGETWREELEIPNLEVEVFNLYREIEPLYVLLHAVIRHKLLKKYGSETVNPKGPIPIHLLGNMWGQDWSALMDSFQISTQNIDLNRKLQGKNMKVQDLVVEAEDFYTSLNLPRMTKKFWQYSIFEENENTTICHGTAANLYNNNDFRMLMCGKTTMEDFYVIHHEMGHIQYYMAYEEQPAFFQDGTNTAFHESVGDAIMHGVMTPQHLHRLSLLTDAQLFDNQTDLFLLFQQALAKIPEIPFSLIVDKYRWDIFSGKVPYDKWNQYYWNLNRKYRGIAPPVERTDHFFDAGAKFHIPDNTPYIRYFLSSIIQMQMFESMCQVALFGTVPEGDAHLSYLQRCDIYGSKNVGKRLWAMMEKGSSIHWSEALSIISGTKQISTEPLLQYYKPVFKWLQEYIQENNVYVGW